MATPLRLTRNEIELLRDLEVGFYVTPPEDEAWARLIAAGFVEICPPPAPPIRLTALGRRHIPMRGVA